MNELREWSRNLFRVGVEKFPIYGKAVNSVASRQKGALLSREHIYILL